MEHHLAPRHGLGAIAEHPEAEREDAETSRFLPHGPQVGILPWLRHGLVVAIRPDHAGERAQHALRQFADVFDPGSAIGSERLQGSGV